MEFYNRGGQGPDDISTEELTAAGVERDPSIRPLGLTPAEIDTVVSFMRTTAAPLQIFPVDLLSVPDRVPSDLLPPGIPTREYRGPYYLQKRAQ